MRNTTALTDEIDTLGVAWHEVAHGLAGKLGGLKVGRLRIKRSWWTGKVSCGYTVIDIPETAPTAMWDAVAVMLFAGLEAQLRYLDQAGALTSTIQARIEHGAAGDYELWQQITHRCSMSEAAVRRATDQFLTRHYNRLANLAGQLATRMRLAGSAL